MVMEVELISSGGGDAVESKDEVAAVGLELYSIGNFATNVDVEWYDVDISPSARMWRRGGRTRQNEDGSTPGDLHLAWVSSPVPMSLRLAAASPAYFFGVGESNITDPDTTDTTTSMTTPMQRATATLASLLAMSPQDKSRLWVEHYQAWGELWELSTIEMDTNRRLTLTLTLPSPSPNPNPNRSDIARAVNATLYGMLSLHDESDTVVVE